MKIKHQLALTIAFLIVGSISIGAGVFYSVDVLRREAVAMYDGTTMAISFARSAKANILIAERQVVAFSDQSEAFDFDELDVALDDLVTDLEVVQERSTSQITKSSVGRILPDAEVLYEEIYSLYDEEQRLPEGIMARLEAMSAQIEVIVEAEAEAGYLAREQVVADGRQIMLQSSALVGLIQLAICINLIWVGVRLSVRLGKFNRALYRCANGELDHDVPYRDSKDEIGAIASTLANWRDQLIAVEEFSPIATYKGAGFGVAGAPLVVANEDGEIIYANDAFHHMVEQRHDDFLSEISDFNSDEIVGSCLHKLMALHPDLAKGLEDESVLPVARKVAVGEAYIGFKIEAVRDADGAIMGFVVDCRDQTYQMAADALARTIEEGQCRLQMSLDQRVTSLNQLLADALKQPAEVLKGQDAGQMVSLHDDGDGEGLFTRLDRGEQVTGLFQLTSSAAQVLIDGNVSPVPNHRGEPSGFLLIGSDVTTAHAERSEAEARQQQMMAAQSAVVDALSHNLKQVSQGVLTAMIERPFSADYEQLRLNFNEALSSLLEAVRVVTTASENISIGTADIQQASAHLSGKTEEQSRSLRDTTSAINDLTALVHNGAEEVSRAASRVQSAKASALEGNQAVENVVNVIGEIESSSQQISKIVDLIDDIAFQTNLLALNAGVEAARAGETGRGFAVVASEVRALAQRSADAAGEIGELIQSSGKLVKNGVGVAQDAGTAIRGIVEAIEDIATRVEFIDKLATEQSSRIGQVNTTVKTIDAATQENATLAEKLTGTSLDLDQRAQVLKQAVAQFDIADGDPLVRELSATQGQDIQQRAALRR
ncbi:MAG: methyl-accepting chemotaxis protein [Paracoccaceae bacterium]|nr:methyl-accepting chemotaxis protein [Paracoccaceae bacterium]